MMMMMITIKYLEIKQILALDNPCGLDTTLTK